MGGSALESRLSLSLNQCNVEYVRPDGAIHEYPRSMGAYVTWDAGDGVYNNSPGSRRCNDQGSALIPSPRQQAHKTLLCDIEEPNRALYREKGYEKRKQH